ncbi:alanine racemase [Chondrinema litorale]|uniref:alanine racemase n=1 Tax=Chondrinema litorale TaxID=2994555 RepID=UPI0025439C33|nr:alanine racemase [Chondrinema litorale]UZR98332.1 alanine racemase [Chondrinema litorale]
MKTYQQYKEILSGQSFPYACLDMDLLKENIRINLVRAKNKKIRIASKSIRIPELMKYILESDTKFEGIMAYHGKEAVYLSQQGFDNILLGYPIVDKSILIEIGEEIKKGKYICLMLDSKDHLEIVESVGKSIGVKFPICLDIDMSQDYPGVHFGVWRSSIVDEQSLEEVLKAITQLEFVQLDGLMGYEAQIAGIGDKVKGNGLKNNVIRLLKNRSVPKIKAWREKIIAKVKEYGFTIKFFNGGGTGSMETTIQEEGITEVTVGSGFFCSHLFDYYTNFTLYPSLFYAIQIVRKPKSNIYTCHGGGFTASGGVEKTKAPILYLPEGGKFDTNEGAGEVQTPVFFEQNNIDLQIGDPIYLRHAKAGELCERFNEVLIIEGGKLKTENLKTYRGLGLNFG